MIIVTLQVAGAIILILSAVLLAYSSLLRNLFLTNASQQRIIVMSGGIEKPPEGEKMTTIGIHNALAAIKAAGWDQVSDGNNSTYLVDDISVDEDDQEYVIDADAVVQLRDGFRADTIWERADA